MNYSKKSNTKLLNRFQKIFNDGNIDDGDNLMNINIDKNITDKLFKYQILHFYDLITSLTDNNIAIDGSQTGTGKTYIAIALCKHFKLSPVIVCLKSVISMWKEVCDTFNIKPTLIVNYETIKKGSHEILKCNNSTNKFIWNLNKDKHLLIFDEAHRCKDPKSLNGKMMLAAKGLCKTLMLSATLSDSADNFYVYGYMLNIFNTIKQCRTLVADIVKNGKNNMSNINPINAYLFPKYGSVMSLADSADSIQKNIISAICYNMNEEDEQQINNSLNIIKDNLEITKIIAARQIIETVKIPIIIELTNKYLNSGKSVVIFVNFLYTLNKLSQELNCMCTIYGQQTMEERDKNIDDFQKNKSKIIILTLQSGGQSINLHDKTGHHPRVSLIIPSFSSVDLVQALGRIHRSGVKSFCYQNIIFCANTYEENICKKIKNKIKFMKDMNTDTFEKNIIDDDFLI